MSDLARLWWRQLQQERFARAKQDEHERFLAVYRHELAKAAS